jgi:GNAT superfamily N-acetyltransferase
MRRPDGIVVRFMLDRERDAVIELSERFHQTHEMSRIWTRWGSWEMSPPVVAADGDRVIGFHTVTYGKRNGYVNSYYQGVAVDYQGKGIAGDMVRVVLIEAIRLRMRRLKFRANKGSPGDAFWQGFGARPFAEQHEQHIFDVDIGGLEDAVREHDGDVMKGFADWMAHPERHAPIPARSMIGWRKLSGITVYAQQAVTP